MFSGYKCFRNTINAGNELNKQNNTKQRNCPWSWIYKNKRKEETTSWKQIRTKRPNNYRVWKQNSKWAFDLNNKLHVMLFTVLVMLSRQCCPYFLFEMLCHLLYPMFLLIKIMFLLIYISFQSILLRLCLKKVTLEMFLLIKLMFFPINAMFISTILNVPTYNGNVNV